MAGALHLDGLVSSRPELGPTPPDGGYGWLIVASAFVYHATAPSVLTLYGIIVLKSLREDDHDETVALRVWDVDIALVPFIAVVLKLLLEAWCRAVVRSVHMPRFAALGGVCATVAGVLLSSFSASVDENDVIVSVFAGIFIGLGCALTGQQTEVIITHYFRDKLTVVQRLVRMAPALGNAVTPVLAAAMCAKRTSEVVIMVYAAIIMQNCFFLVSFTRPVYIEKVIRQTYNFMRDAVDDEDEVVFNQTGPPDAPTGSGRPPDRPADQPTDDDQVVVFESSRGAAELADERRFSSDFGALRLDADRFSSDFTACEAGRPGYQELASIDHAPQPLYRETTETNATNSVFVNPEMTPGTARRTASVKKNLITLVSMLKDVEFYLYTLTLLCTTFSSTVLAVLFPALVWERNPALTVWGAAAAAAASHAAALCLVGLCVLLPKGLAGKYRLGAGLCAVGALGFYGATVSTQKLALIASGALASTAAACAHVLQQPIYNNFLNEFDTTATSAAANSLAGALLLAWCLSGNFEYRSCFFAATCLQALTGCLLFGGGLRAAARSRERR